MNRRQLLAAGLGAGAVLGADVASAAMANEGAIERHDPDPDPPGVSATGIRARWIRTVADDFIVDIWHNGVKVPDQKRTLQDEVFGATVERIEIDLASKDWLVFNVVNNRMRWGGVYYFAMAGFVAENELTLATELESGAWSVCDDTSLVARFISKPGFLSDRKPLPIATPWDQGATRMAQISNNQWKGVPIWGTSRNTWLKLRV